MVCHHKNSDSSRLSVTNPEIYKLNKKQKLVSVLQHGIGPCKDDQIGKKNPK